MTDGGAAVVVASADESVCELLGRVVEAAGHRAVRVSDASAVVDAVLHAGADAALLDLGAGNLDLVTSLRGQGEPIGSEVRIVVVEVGPASSRLAWEAGVDAVLTRPFPATEIGDALTGALARTDDDRAAERQARLARLSA